MCRAVGADAALASMPIRPPQFDMAAEVLVPHLSGLPPKVVAIDGRAGVGKTTLGRFLAWYFNSSLVELDLFLGEGGLVHRELEVGRIVKHRLGLRRPVFVEGLLVLDVLKAIDVEPDYIIYVRNPKCPKGLGFYQEMNDYESRQRPAEVANYVLEIEHDD